MADALSDAAWAAICAAAKRTPDAGTRERLSTILFEDYPAFAYDRKRVAAALRQSERMLKQLDKFAKDYCQAWLPHLPTDQFEAILDGRAEAFIADDTLIARDLWCITRLRRRVLTELLAARAIRRAHRGHGNVQQEWLYNQLCTVWLWDFHANELTFSVPSWGGPPYGPLIDFMLAAIRQVPSEAELPSPYALRDAILRERKERENARQLGLFLQKHLPSPGLLC
jgi:hypothetical protein